MAKVTKDSVEIGEPESAETQWGFAEGLRGCKFLKHSFALRHPSKTLDFPIRAMQTDPLSDELDGNSDETV